MKPVTLAFPAVAVGFFLLFSPWTRQSVPFWPTMAIMAAALATFTLMIDYREAPWQYHFRRSQLVWGLGAMVVLYMVFWLGRGVVTWLIPGTTTQIDSIYLIREEVDPFIIGSLLLLVIGPAEELFWRGLVQRRLAVRFGWLGGLVIGTLLYTSVHLASCNPMLIAAAGLCGIFWGVLYLITGNLWPGIISHALWDVVIFIILPVQS